MRIVGELMEYLLNLNPSSNPLHLSAFVGLAGRVAGLVPVEVGVVMASAEGQGQEVVERVVSD